MIEIVGLAGGVAGIYVLGYIFHKYKNNREGVMSNRSRVLKAMQNVYSGGEAETGVREIKRAEEKLDNKSFMNYILPVIKEMQPGNGGDNGGAEEGSPEEGYLQCTASSSVKKDVAVQLFKMKRITDVKHVVNALRKGNIVPMINSKELRRWDDMQYKRAVRQLKTVADGNSSRIYVLDQDNMVIVPGFARMSMKK